MTLKVQDKMLKNFILNNIKKRKNRNTGVFLWLKDPDPDPQH